MIDMGRLPRLYRVIYCLVSLKFLLSLPNRDKYHPLSAIVTLNLKTSTPCHISKHRSFSGKKVVWWNWLDLLIVLSGFAEMLLPLLVSGHSPLHLSGLRGLRLLRLARIARGLTLGWSWGSFRRGKGGERWKCCCQRALGIVALSGFFSERKHRHFSWLEIFWWKKSFEILEIHDSP